MADKPPESSPHLNFSNHWKLAGRSVSDRTAYDHHQPLTKGVGMAYAKIMFEHPEIGTVRKAPVGFSWTTLLFGPIVGLFRKDLLWTFWMLLAAAVTSGVSLVIFPFFYNKVYIKRLLKKGYRVSSTEGAELDLLKKKLELVLPGK
jgi:hypothetical protein